MLHDQKKYMLSLAKCKNANGGPAPTPKRLESILSVHHILAVPDSPCFDSKMQIKQSVYKLQRVQWDKEAERILFFN